MNKERYPIAYHTVDILVYKIDITYNNKSIVYSSTSDAKERYVNILLGRKPGQTKFQVPGGFVDPSDNSAEEAAVRELKEETNLIVKPILFYEKRAWVPSYHGLFYEGSFKIDDERYRKTEHKIITSFYSVSVNHVDEAKVGDDLEELKWFQFNFKRSEEKLLDEFLSSNVVDKHHVLLKKFNNNWTND